MNRLSGPTRVAFVGGGAMARAHLRALQRLGPAARVFGVYDADPATAQEFATLSVSRAFPTLDAMLATVRPEVVHVCTTAGNHADAARQALAMGAHIYVEKPFVESYVEASELIALAASKHRLICCGHQILADPAYERLLEVATSVEPYTHAESTFFFRSPTLRPGAAPAMVAAQLLDILPHPLYSLVAALELMSPGSRVELARAEISASMVDAVLRAGAVTGRLHVSLRARPVASTLTLTGENGTVTADFIRGSVSGIDNPGTTPFEKILNPMVAGMRLAWRSIVGVVHRIAKQGEYPGLSELLYRFYDATRHGLPSPVTPDHLATVVRIQEEIAINVREAARTEIPRDMLPPSSVAPGGPVVALTGAGGFFGRAIAAELAARGFRVRGIGRGHDPADANIAEWVRADLSRALAPDAFAGVAAVVHAAAATAGGFAAHQRNSVDVAYHVVDAAAHAGVKHVVHISSLSVVRPPSGFHDVQDERTPMAEESRSLGAYTWGKCVSEGVVLQRAALAGIRVRTIRPAALIDWLAPELPGLAGKRLFGNWHLGLGRPSLPIPTCGVDTAAAAVAWTVANFDQAAPVVNLIDPEVTSRGELLRRMRRHGWSGRMLWVPISLLAVGVIVAQRVIALVARRRGEALSVWQVLRPRYFRTTLSSRLIGALREEAVERKVNSSAAA
jgi:predicted dehydrogenase/nucleoside-diphosphate-sugar epimerase